MLFILAEKLSEEEQLAMAKLNKWHGLGSSCDVIFGE